MIEVLRILLGVLLITSLVTVVAYAVIFFAIAAWSALRAPRHDPLADELDAVLAELWEVTAATYCDAAAPRMRRRRSRALVSKLHHLAQ